MDNKFVPNFTFDFDRAAQIIKDCPIPVDSHLMVVEPEQAAPAFAEMGSASVTFHFEAAVKPREIVKSVHARGARVGVGLKPGTSFSAIEDFIDEIDMVLVMTVEPGFGGQKFMENMMEKVRKTRTMIGDRPIWLQVDGGISMQTIEMALEAGADTFVVGSAVFNAPEPAVMVETLRHAAGDL